MSTTLYAHADGAARTEVPTISIKEWTGYVSVSIEHGDNLVVFYVNAQEGEDQDSLVGRVIRSLVPTISPKES